MTWQDYEANLEREDFLCFSYRIQPGQGRHDAPDALSVAIGGTRENWILDADIRSVFDRLSQQWMVRFMAHRVGGERIVLLVRKWLKAGVSGDAVWSLSAMRAPQGAVASSLLVNLYLHDAFDLWPARAPLPPR